MKKTIITTTKSGCKLLGLTILLITIFIYAGKINGARLSLTDISCEKGMSVELPVYLENSEEVVAMQFKIKQSGSNITFGTNPIITNRGEDHVISIGNSTTNPSYLIYSPSNRPIKDNSGMIIKIPITLSKYATEGSKISMTLSDVVLTDKNGNAVDCEVLNAALTVETLPHLSVSSSVQDIEEGESFVLSVSTTQAPDEPLPLIIEADLPSRFIIPAASIPAGETSVSINVKSIDDDIPDLDRDIAFMVSATKHHSATCEVTLIDNDLPTLQLQLQPNEVNENDGPRAVKAIISRLDHTNSNVKVKISDNSGGRLIYDVTSIDFVSGETVKEIYLGVKDDALAQGDQVYDITAAVWLSSCGCLSNGESRGAVTKQLIVHDNDGPALQLNASKVSIKEGESLSVTVTRNTPTTSALTVKLSTDVKSGFTCPTSVTIPKGADSAKFTVKATANQINDDSFDVVVSASANGYAGSSLWLHVTDATLPDAKVKSINISQVTIYPKDKVTANIIISNVGSYNLPASTKVTLMLDKETIATTTIGSMLAPSKEITLSQEINIPDIVGELKVRAIVNGDHSVKEQSYNNQEAQCNINVLAPFSVGLSSDKSSYNIGENVSIRGQLSGNKTAGCPVNVYVQMQGLNKIIETTSDSEGAFEVNYSPSLTGIYNLSAGYPKQKNPSASASFSVYGLVFNSSFSECEVKKGESGNASVKLTNNSPAPLTSISVTPIENPEFADLTIDYPSTIEAGGSAQITYKLVGKEVSTPNKNPIKIPIKVTTNEGVESNHQLYYCVMEAAGKLESSESAINTTMSIETSREYPLVLRNTGRAPTGKVTIDTGTSGLITSITPVSFPSIEPGDSVNVLLRFNPLDNMDTGVEYEGTIVAHCETCDDIKIPYTLKTVAEGTGILKLDVVDNYTYYTEEAPHVSGASIEVLRSATQQEVASGITDTNGIYSVELEPALYVVKISAPGHAVCEKKLRVNPGMENAYEVFFSCSNVEYEWDVEMTEIEDTYNGKIVAKFDTDVPMPRVSIELPDVRPQVDDIFQIKVKNSGYISVSNLDLSLNVSEGMSVTFMNLPVLDELAAGQEALFYAKLTEKASAATVRENAPIASASDSGKDKCFDIIAYSHYNYPCGKYPQGGNTKGRRVYGSCTPEELNNNAGKGSAGSSTGSTGGSGGPSIPTGAAYEYYEVRDIDHEIPLFPTEPVVDCNPKSVPMRPLGLYDPWPEIPMTDPGETPCGESPILNYKIVSQESHTLRKGVAADGCSKLLLVLDSGSSIPSEDCGYTMEWSLDEKYGFIINDDAWNEVLYLAPDRYPGTELRESVELEFLITGKWTGGGKSGTVEIPVKLVRTPLVLLHDFNQDESSWEPFRKHLVNPESGAPKYRDYQVDNASYFGMGAYYDNAKVAYNRIMQLLQGYLLEGFEAHQADVIGHGTGGVIARLCAQELDRPDLIHKLITLNSPHSGSEYYDLAFLLSSVGLPPYNIMQFGNLIISLMSPNKSCAMWDMGANSYTTDAKLNGPSLRKLTGVPIATLATHSPDSESAAQIMQGVGTVMSWIPDPYGICKIVGTAISAISELHQSYQPCDEYIPIDSQLGGCSAGIQIYPMYSSSLKHNESLKDSYSVWKKLEELLLVGADTPVFSKDGLNPPDRSFSALGVAVDIIKDLLIEKIGVGKFIKGKLLKDKSVAQMGESFVDFTWDASLEAGKAAKELTCEFGGNLLNMLSKNDKDSIRRTKTNDSSDFSDSITDLVLFTCVEGDNIYYSYNKELNIKVPGWYEGSLEVYALYQTADGNWYKDSMSIDMGESMCTLESIDAKPINIDEEENAYPVITCNWSDGSVSYVAPENVSFGRPIASWSEGTIRPIMTGETTATLGYKEKSVQVPLNIVSLPAPYMESQEEMEESICSSVQLEIGQTATFTREAVRGSLKVTNGNDMTPLEDFKLELEVRDADGNKVNSDRFGISLESLEGGFAGVASLDNTWTLYAGSQGKVNVLFVPTDFAAPTIPTEYYFGGRFSYLDSGQDLVVTHELKPVKITVNPSPRVNLNYFLEPAIWGDDPMTETEVEPSEEAEMALLVSNVGAGDIRNMQLTTVQPQIRENEKGLAVGFEIVRSALNGQESLVYMGEDIPTQFGSLKSGTSSVAQWWLKSTVTGRIDEYDATFNRISDYGSSHTSLLGDVRCHKLIRSIDPMRKETYVGFLTDDIADDQNVPDLLYLSDGSVEYVSNAANAELTGDEYTYVLTLTPSKAGWNYGEITDPTCGTADLISIRRLKDGKEISSRNFWLTDRTFISDKKIEYENVLHFIDNFESMSSCDYELTFAKNPTSAVHEVGDVGFNDNKGGSSERRSDGTFSISTLDGIVIIQKATSEDLKKLTKGIYIVDGRVIVIP